MLSKSKTLRHGGVAAVALAGALGVGAATQAATSAMEAETYEAYHQAIYVAAECENRNFYQDSAYNQDWDGREAQEAQMAQAKMAHVINSKTKNMATSGHDLAMIENAKTKAQQLINQQGCEGSDVQALLALFHADLEPALALDLAYLKN